MDESYREASDEIIRAAYPSELIDIADPKEGDRDKAVRWFMHTADLGEGSARNKAATYFLIGAADPSDETPKPKSTSRTKKAKTTSPSTSKQHDMKKKALKRNDYGDEADVSDVIPLNVNVQIHISADATKDQIETIFASMKKYLRS